MKICLTNHFETDLEADIYVACLPYNRPIIRPARSPGTSHVFVFSLWEMPRIDGNWAKAMNLLSSSGEVSSSTMKLNQTRQHVLSDFQWHHCDHKTLINYLINPSYHLHGNKAPWFLASFGDHRQNLGIWVFHQCNPVALIPLGTPCSMVIDWAKYQPWTINPEIMIQKTLANFVDLWRQTKFIFNFDVFNKKSLELLAFIRCLSGKEQIYGFSQEKDFYQHLKFFNFLTHDIPKNREIVISELLMDWEIFLNYLNPSKILNKKALRYIENYFPPSAKDVNRGSYP